MNGMGSTGCLLLTLVFGLIVFLAQGVLTFLWDFFTSPLLYFFCSSSNCLFPRMS